MQQLKVLGTIAACAVAVSGAAHAQTAYRGEATLASPTAQVREIIVAGVPWRCEADKCLGYSPSYGRLDPLVEQCVRLAKVVGPLSAFTAKRRPLSEAGMATCNAAVTPASGPATVAQK